MHSQKVDSTRSRILQLDEFKCIVVIGAIVGRAGLYMISVIASDGVDITKVATAGPDQELLIGGLFGPVRFW